MEISHHKIFTENRITSLKDRQLCTTTVVCILHFEKVYDINFHCEKIQFWGFVDCKPRIPLLNILSLFEAIGPVLDCLLFVMRVPSADQWSQI